MYYWYIVCIYIYCMPGRETDMISIPISILLKVFPIWPLDGLITGSPATGGQPWFESSSAAAAAAPNPHPKPSSNGWKEACRKF